MIEFIDKIRNVRLIDDAVKVLGQLIEIDKDIKKAIDFAVQAHSNQFRRSGEPYVIHPILVAGITAAISNDKIMVIAALLHDVVEDTSYTRDDIKDIFGEEVANLVDGLTKIFDIREEKLISSRSNEKLLKSALSFRKMLLVSIKDVRVLVIKLCDRLHNMLTLDVLPPHKTEENRPRDSL